MAGRVVFKCQFHSGRTYLGPPLTPKFKSKPLTCQPLGEPRTLVAFGKEVVEGHEELGDLPVEGCFFFFVGGGEWTGILITGVVVEVSVGICLWNVDE